MKPIDYIIIAAAVAAVVGVIIKSIRDKKNGKTGCGCGCESCPSRGACAGSSARRETLDKESLDKETLDKESLDKNKRGERERDGDKTLDKEN